MSCDGQGVLIVETITSARQPRWRAGHAAPDLARAQQTASPVNNNSSDGGRKTCSVVTSCDVVLGAIGWLRMMPLPMFRLRATNQKSFLSRCNNQSGRENLN